MRMRCVKRDRQRTCFHDKGLKMALNMLEEVEGMESSRALDMERRN